MKTDSNILYSSFMKKVILFLILISLHFFTKPVQAQGLLGGEIRWDCILSGNNNAGKFVFYLKVYQACYNDTSANPVLPNSQLLISNSPAGNRNMTLLSGYPKDISPICNPDTTLAHTNCSSPDSISAFNGAHRVYIYVDTFAVSGNPPAYGWTFSWNGGKRNRSTNLVDSLNPSMRLRSIMYPYGTQSAYPCFDNSPIMAESPVVTTCNGYPFMYFSAGSDKELDSLHFEWEELKDSINSNVSFTTNHSYLNPLPNTSDNPNNTPAILHPFFGETTLTTYTEGGFFANQLVTAYKCGIKVAEIYRDMYFQFYDCGTNVSPIMQTPFNNGASTIDTIYAGDRISVNLNFTDSQQLMPGVMQSLSMQAYGLQFGNYIPSNGSNPPIFDTTAGCINPPCASLSAAPSDSLPLHDTTSISTQFTWQTDCGHLSTSAGCGNISNIYNFYFKYWDDYCPVPAYNWGKITYVIKPRPALPPPIMDSLSVNPQNGAATLYWKPVYDSLNIFLKYSIFSSNQKNGPYSWRQDLSNINDSIYTDTTANALLNKTFYYIITWSGCSTWINSLGTSDTLHNYISNLKIQSLNNPFDNNNSVIAKVKNIGSDDIDTIRFRFMQPDSSWVTEQWTGSLEADNLLSYVFSSNFQVSYNPSFRLGVHADITNDIDTSDNVIYATDTLGHTDLKLEELYNPYIYPNLNVQVSVKNLGYTSFDTIRFSFKQPDNTLVSETWTGSLLSGKSLSFRFQQSYIPSYHPNYYLCVKAEVLSDIDISNNRRCRSTPLSINEYNSEDFQILSNRPNPAKENTQIRFILPKKAIIQLRVFDISGRIITHKQIEAKDGENSYLLNVSSLDNGIYYYQLIFEEIYLNAKFVILR